MKLLIADSDRETVNLVHESFITDDFSIVSAADEEAVLRLFRTMSPDFVFLNSRLNKRSTLPLLPDLRHQTDAPIAMLADRPDDDDQVNALGRGADDYIVKPVAAKVLRARALALLRRTQAARSASSRSALEFGGVRLDPQTRRVSVDGKSIRLSRTEFALLEFLMLNHDVVVRLPNLITNVWGYEGTESENVVKVAISRLRRKIEQDPTVPRYIVNVPGIGYMFQQSDGRPSAAAGS